MLTGLVFKKKLSKQCYSYRPISCHLKKQPALIPPQLPSLDALILIPNPFTQTSIFHNPLFPKSLIG